MWDTFRSGWQARVTPEQLGKLARRIVEEYGLPLHGKLKLEKIAAILREELGGGKCE